MQLNLLDKDPKDIHSNKLTRDEETPSLVGSIEGKTIKTEVTNSSFLYKLLHDIIVTLLHSYLLILLLKAQPMKELQNTILKYYYTTHMINIYTPLHTK